MILEQIYTGCLAQGAYFIESNGEAAVIDPLREVQQYINLAGERNANIKYIFETHFHADFVSGHVDLAAKTGAEIIYGPTEMKTGFKCTVAEDGEEFKIGNATIRVIHTPGHTMESSCYLLIDESGKEKALFTGDTLFIGDVGRPDLAQHVISDLTERKLAGLLYDSLRNKIMKLDDDLIVYPAHGAGSACGKNMSKETSDTLGNQKKTNYALREGLSKEDFTEELIAGLTAPPGYFPQNVLMNIHGYGSIDEILDRGTRGLSLEEFDSEFNSGDALILDTRESDNFIRGFIPGSLNISLNGSFAVWAGTLIKDINQKILLICEPGKETETVTRLARVGYDNTAGYLSGGMDTWVKAGRRIDTIKTVSVKDLLELKDTGNKLNFVDVRKKSEYDSEHIIDALNAPLDYINNSIKKLDKEMTYYVHCESGYRSVIFASILKSKGYDNLVNISGGFIEIKSSGKFDTSEYVCPLTML